METEEEEEEGKNETNPIKNSFKLGFFTLSMLYIQKKTCCEKKITKKFLFFSKKNNSVYERECNKTNIYIYI